MWTLARPFGGFALRGNSVGLQNALVHAGTGDVGNLAVRIALAYGAKVFTTVSDDKRDVVENLGALAISRHSPVEEYLAQHTAGEGFDIVYDTAGGGDSELSNNS